MSRKLLGFVAAVLLALGFIVLITGPAGSSKDAFAGGCIRVGLVLAALWLALPQIQAMITAAPRSLFGFFFGKKNKTPPPDSSSQPQPQPQRPPPRPRRRSTSH